jgi:hypothetical protein
MSRPPHHPRITFQKYFMKSTKYEAEMRSFQSRSSNEHLSLVDMHFERTEQWYKQRRMESRKPTEHFLYGCTFFT